MSLNMYMDRATLRSEDKRGDRCRSCKKSFTSAPLCLGCLPPSNRFSIKYEVLPKHKFVVQRCENCGLIQMQRPMPPAMVTPRMFEVQYNEPTKHLMDLSKKIIDIYGSIPRVHLGIGPFESPLAKIFRDLGVVTETINPCFESSNDLFPYLESWQALISQRSFFSELYEKINPDIISCRYLLEHCHDPLSALTGLAQHVSPNGLLIIEVPDSTKFLRAGDYSFLWEEHICYFTEHTLTQLCIRAGLAPQVVLRYCGDLEDALIVIANSKNTYSRLVEPSEDLFADYKFNFQKQRYKINQQLTEARETGSVAIFGAGHQAIMFVNAFDVSAQINYMVDDDKKKLGKFPPGLSQPIRSRDDLLQDENLRLCLLAISPSSEDKVRRSLNALSIRGIDLKSIYSANEHSIYDRA